MITGAILGALFGALLIPCPVPFPFPFFIGSAVTMLAMWMLGLMGVVIGLSFYPLLVLQLPSPLPLPLPYLLLG